MADFFPFPKECIWLQGGRITKLVTRQNTDLGQPFTPMDVLDLHNDAVLAALARDVMVSSPTPGFSTAIEGQIIGINVVLQVDLKIHELFATPRTSGAYASSIGISGELYDPRTKLWQKIMAMVRLGSGRDRWSMIHCYLQGTQT